MIERAVLDEEIGQDVQDIVWPQSPRKLDSLTLPDELVHHRQQAESPAVVGPSLDEVVCPDMILPEWNFAVR